MSSVDSPYFRRTGDAVVLSVRVLPRASRAEVLGVKGGALRVRLTAPPVQGEANAQLTVLLAKALGVSKSRISILRGHASRNKQVLIEGIRDMPFG